VWFWFIFNIPFTLWWDGLPETLGGCSTIAQNHELEIETGNRIIVSKLIELALANQIQQRTSEHQDH
jgi:hypothetical protein